MNSLHDFMCSTEIQKKLWFKSAPCGPLRKVDGSVECLAERREVKGGARLKNAEPKEATKLLEGFVNIAEDESYPFRQYYKVRGTYCMISKTLLLFSVLVCYGPLAKH